MGVFDNILKNGESLFLNEVVLDHEYMPSVVKFRENQQVYIANCIKLVLEKRSGKNVFVFGQPGIGKTLAIKSLFKELQEKGLDENLYLVYVNCWKKDTAHKMIMNICDQINYKFTHNKTTDELIKKVTDIVNKKSLVLCIDEFDKLKEFDALYSILSEVYRKVIILITNEKNFLSTIDSRLRSRLTPDLVEFNPYNYEETKAILQQRLDYAFVKNIWDKEAFSSIVDKAFELKDIRLGLSLLRQSGINAENKSSRKILNEHSIQAINQLANFTIKNSKTLNQDDNYILQLVKDNSGRLAGEIFDIYKNQTNKSYSTFMRKIKSLEESGLIKTESIISDLGGKSTILKYEEDKKLNGF